MMRQVVVVVVVRLLLPLLLLLLLVSQTVVVQAVVTFDNDAIELSLPSNLGILTDITSQLVDENNDKLVPVLLPLAPAGKLVTLNAIDKGTVYVPVGRSYNLNHWESVAGTYETLQYECKDPNIFGTLTHQCQVYLPIKDTITYHLTMYTHEISQRAEISRFLERATFGGTPTEILELESATASGGGGNLQLSLANYITDQIYNVDVTSHREYFRKRLNPRSIENYKYGITGPNACERNSRYRTFAFTTKDLRLSTYELKYNLEIEQVIANDNSGTIGYVLKFANHIRTVLTQPLEYYGGTGSNTINIEGTVGAGSYKLCYVEEIEGKKRSGINDVRTFAIEVFEDDCRFIKGGKYKHTYYMVSLTVTSSLYILLPIDFSFTATLLLLLANR